MLNHALLRRLLAERRIALEPAPLLDASPRTPAAPRERLRDRVEGMLLGLAIGDALGNTTEGQHPRARREAHGGEIRDYRPNPRAGGRPVGLPSDDTQLAFATLRRLLEDGRLDPDALLREFGSRPIFGIGQTVRTALERYRRGHPWYEAGVPSAGNGALMRIAPVLVPHLASPSPELWADAALAAMITHNDRSSTAACLAFVALLWELLDRDDIPAPEWWLDTFVATARELEGDAASYTARTPRTPYEGPLWRFVDERVREAMAEEHDVIDAGDAWHSGAYLLETVPSVLYILCRHGHDPEEAIVRAVNDTWDNDTAAAIVGAAVGALHGRRALAERWITGLLGRTAADDDGEVFRLTGAAVERWVR
ncbi:MAG TPA: ADP-ribosylglycohydrolase family protein [Longimicrobiales bacterium]